MAEKLLLIHKEKIAGLELVPSHGGVFEVKFDGKLIFSKKEEKRFPDVNEVENIVMQKISSNIFSL